MFDFLAEMVGIVAGVVCAASFVASITPTPKDDELLGKFYRVIEIMALNIGKAKMLPPNKS